MIRRRLLASLLVGVAVGWGMWLAPLHRPRAVLPASEGAIGAPFCYFSPDSSDLVTIHKVEPDLEKQEVGERGLVQLWDAGSGRRRAVLSKSQPFTNSVTWSPDGKRVAGRMANARVLVWNRRTGEVDKEFWAYSLRDVRPNSQIVYDAENRLMFQQSFPETEIWDIETEKPVLRGSHRLLTSIQESDGPFQGFLVGGDYRKYIAIRLDDGSSVDFDMPTGAYSRKFSLSPDGRSCVAWTTTNAWFRSAPTTTNIWIWTSRARYELPPISWLSLKRSWPYPRLTISNDAKYLAVAVSERRLKWILFGDPVGDPRIRTRFLHPETGESAGALDDVTYVWFSPDRKTVAALASKGEIQLWDLPVRTPLSRILGAAAAAAALTYALRYLRSRPNRGSKPATMVPWYVAGCSRRCSLVSPLAGACGWRPSIGRGRS
jgi:WD40 repeat protein